MLHVPKRHQSCGSLIKAVLRGGLFCCLSALSVRRLYMPVFLFLLVPLHSTKRGKKKNISYFVLLSISCYLHFVFLLIGYPCATFALPLGFLFVCCVSHLRHVCLWQSSRCRRFTASPALPPYPRFPRFPLPLSPYTLHPTPYTLPLNPPLRRLFASPVRHIGVICSPSLACIYLAYSPLHKAAKDAAPPVTCSMRV